MQTLWQAQHFVNLEVKISWQARRFVNLTVQISWQAQHFDALCALISSVAHELGSDEKDWETIEASITPALMLFASAKSTNDGAKGKMFFREALVALQE